MSEEWPNGWYRDEQGRQAQPGFTPRQDAQGSPYEPTQAGRSASSALASSRSATCSGSRATDKPLPKNLITGASVAGTT